MNLAADSTIVGSVVFLFLTVVFVNSNLRAGLPAITILLFAAAIASYVTSRKYPRGARPTVVTLAFVLAALPVYPMMVYNNPTLSRWLCCLAQP